MSILEIIVVAFTGLFILLNIMKGFTGMFMSILEIALYLAAVIFGVVPVGNWLWRITDMQVDVIVWIVVAFFVITFLCVLLFHIPRHWLRKAWRKGKSVHWFDRAVGVFLTVVISFAITSVLTALFNHSDDLVAMLPESVSKLVFQLLGFARVEGATDALSGAVIGLKAQVCDGLFLKYLVDNGNPLGEWVIGMIF